MYNVYNFCFDYVFYDKGKNETTTDSYLMTDETTTDSYSMIDEVYNWSSTLYGLMLPIVLNILLFREIFMMRLKVSLVFK